MQEVVKWNVDGSLNYSSGRYSHYSNHTNRFLQPFMFFYREPIHRVQFLTKNVPFSFTALTKM